MKKNYTLLILAAGMGSRFGGLKQLEPVGPNGEFIIDYSVYDALRTGFNKVVFVIKRENLEIFKETIGKRIEKHIEVEYVFQENSDWPEEYEIPSREKPFGTAHAMRSARHSINEPFVIINADDFYGANAYKKAVTFLSDIKEYKYALGGFPVKKTITKNGSVKRGICSVDENNILKNLLECRIETEDDGLVAYPLSEQNPFSISKNQLVSVNFFIFEPSIFKIIENNVADFFESNKDNLDTAEFFATDVLGKESAANNISIEVIDTDSKWLGVTYKEDKEEVVDEINKMIENGEYPEKLWK